MINFRGGNVIEISQLLEERGVAAKRTPSEDEEGNQSFLIQDPDGNDIYFVQNPDEPPPL